MLWLVGLAGHRSDGHHGKDDHAAPAQACITVRPVMAPGSVGPRRHAILSVIVGLAPGLPLPVRGASYLTGTTRPLTAEPRDR